MSLASLTGMVLARPRPFIGLDLLLFLFLTAPLAHAESAEARLLELSPGQATVRFIAGQQGPCRATMILASGDLGWAGFVTDLAGLLAAQGCDLVGFDVRAYLTAATQRSGALDLASVPRDFLV